MVPGKFFLDFFLSSRPEHNQKPPTDTANRHCAFIPTRRKIAVWPQGAQSTAPLARGRSYGDDLDADVEGVPALAGPRTTPRVRPRPVSELFLHTALLGRPSGRTEGATRRGQDDLGTHDPV